MVKRSVWLACRYCYDFNPLPQPRLEVRPIKEGSLYSNFFFGNPGKGGMVRVPTEVYHFEY
jgi:hypothetical protein